MDLSPGTMVTPNVRLVRLLGEGGMGSVWVGDHLTLETQVAVKFILPELSKDDPDILARFRREAKLAARIKSQHVVRVFDHGVMEDATPFIVMELLEGSSLADWLDLQGCLDLAETAEMVSQVASVLAKAHEIGVIHRDIKPENVFLVDSEDRLFVKVLDFGIAKQTRVPKGSLRTGTGILVGTPSYMSPEQLLRAEGVDARADLWALSVVAYRAVTGTEPFSGETVPAIIVAITDGKFDAPSAVAPQAIPPSVDRWFERALARDSGQRFDSAKALARSFGDAVAGADAAVAGAEVGGMHGGGAAGSHGALVTSPTLHAGTGGTEAVAPNQGNADGMRREPPPRKPQALPTVNATRVDAGFAGAAVDTPKAPPRRGPRLDRAPATRQGLGLGLGAAPSAAVDARSDALSLPPSFELERHEVGASLAGGSRLSELEVRSPSPVRRGEPDEFVPESDRDGPPSWAGGLGQDLHLEPPAHRRTDRLHPAAAARAVPRATASDAPDFMQLVGPSILATVALGVVPLSAGAGLASVERGLGSIAYLAFGLVTLGMAIAIAKLGAAGRRQSSGLLYLATLGLTVLAVCTAVTTAALAAPAAGLGEIAALAALLAPLGAAGVALGLGGYGLVLAKDELLTRRRERLGYAALLLVLSLAGIGIALRLVQRIGAFSDLIG